MDIVLSDPVAECPTLYRYARFLDKHPIRVCIPVVPGFRKAVVVAAALQFAVKLEMGQPNAAVLPELMACLDLYLHDRTVRQPIEFFHSFLYALCHRARITLWDILEQAQAPHRPQPECVRCEYMQHCNGFFKSPNTDYACDGVKVLLAKLKIGRASCRER